ncbi:MAG: uroporphyrinogen decarboxylase family protein [Chloroflexota bacterium]
MSMTERERLLAIYRGETPDRVPFFLDLSHWFYQKHGIPFDLSVPHLEPEWELIDYHKKVGAGFYVPNLNSYFDVSLPPDVIATTTKEEKPGGPEITWRIETPIGAIERKRQWEEASYSWNVSHWGVRTELDLRVLGYALSRRRYAPAWDRYSPWVEALGGLGVVYIGIGYSALGHLLAYWMGIERTIYATVDMPHLLHEVVDQINDNLLQCVDMVCQSPAEVIIMGDNFSGDIQPPRFFKKWSEPFYREAIRRLRQAGKYSAVHIDGRLKGILKSFADLGASCADAVTPAPMGDLTARQCRQEAGPDMVLSGGVPPNLWLPQVPDEVFKQSLLDWLDIRKLSPRLVANAGDQVPPGAPEYRIEMMRELVEKHGRF